MKLQPDDRHFMRLALGLARRALGHTTPNPMVGAILVKQAKIIGRGWHHRAGLPHAEIEALSDAERKGHSPAGSVCYVTLEPCSTQGRTPPCTDALIQARVSRVVAAAIDPNPKHAGRGFGLLEQAGIRVTTGVLEAEALALNQAFNHFIQHLQPFITVKAAMTCDGKIATATGESKWITGTSARYQAMRLRQEADAILVGINTILADDPQLTVRLSHRKQAVPTQADIKQLRRIILDTHARTPLDARVMIKEAGADTLVVVGQNAPQRKIKALCQHAQVWVAPLEAGRIDLPWLLRRLGQEQVTHLLVEGGGTVNASFLMRRLAHRVAFFFAPKILGGQHDLKAVAGLGAASWPECLELESIQWRRLGLDLLLLARIKPDAPRPSL
jgi:diaminohydroxyphosphoribosylaminopyrimidine deaminase / 5-amino-6-(5-phosphoribosylamino)uracil reductase